MKLDSRITLVHFFVQVDLLYVHNPAEMQLAQLGKKTFFARLSAAFQALEKLRCDSFCIPDAARPELQKLDSSTLLL